MEFYVCPVCGNVIQTIGKGSYSCCGVMLPVAEVEVDNEIHQIVQRWLNFTRNKILSADLRKEGMGLSMYTAIDTDYLEVLFKSN